MANPLLHAGTTVLCTHAGTVRFITSARVKINGQPVIVQTDPNAVTGCSFTVTVGVVSKPQPCVQVKFVSAATRVRVNGQPVLLSTSQGICQSAEGVPQGKPSIASTQVRVKGE